MYHALSNALIFNEDEIISGKSLLIEGELIKGLAEENDIPANIDVIDCRDRLIAPGFIDLQIAGAGGYLFSSNIFPEALEKIADSIVKTGTTGFLLVLPTNSPDIYHQAIATIKSNPHPALLGLHLEGPYISIEKRGAHILEHIRKPEMKELGSLLREGEGIIKMVTVAPEVCSREFIGMLNKHGVVVCAGHSNATFSEAIDGFRWGIKGTTHLFNAMSPLHHRDSGLPGATFQTGNIMASIVADGIHVDFNTLSIAKKLLKERLYLISDAVEDNRHGAYQHIRQKDRYTLTDGTLSGSALTMITAVKNCIQKAGIQKEEAIRMASLYPAKLMGLSDRGRIAPGMNADLVVIDKEYNIRHVFSKGKEIR